MTLHSHTSTRDLAAIGIGGSRWLTFQQALCCSIHQCKCGDEVAAVWPALAVKPPYMVCRWRRPLCCVKLLLGPTTFLRPTASAISTQLLHIFGRDLGFRSPDSSDTASCYGASKATPAALSTMAQYHQPGAAPELSQPCRGAASVAVYVLHETGASHYHYHST